MQTRPKFSLNKTKVFDTGKQTRPKFSLNKHTTNGLKSLSDFIQEATQL